MEEQRSKFFLSVFVAAFVLLSAVAVSIAVFFDPKNEAKNAFHAFISDVSAPRKHHLFADYTRLSPSTLIVGSSRVSELDTNHPALAAIEGGAFSLSFAGPDMVDLANAVELALDNKRLRRVVLGLDFYAFNRNYKSVRTTRMGVASKWQRLRLHVIHLLRLALNRDILKRSLKYVISTPRTKGVEPRILKPAVTQPAEGVLQRFQSSEEELFRNMWFPGDTRFNLRDRFVRNSDQLNALERTLRGLREHGVETILCISPVHARTLIAIDEAGLWSDFEQWKRELVHITEKISTTETTIRLWDFSGFNSITVENLPSDRAAKTGVRNFKDVSHFTDVVGNYVLNKLLAYRPIQGTAPGDFGIPLSSRAIEPWLQATREKKSRYLTSHQEDLREIQALIRNILKVEPLSTKAAQGNQFRTY